MPAAILGRVRWPGIGELVATRPWLLPSAVSVVGWASLLCWRHQPQGHHGHVVVVAAMTAAMMGPLAGPLCRVTARASLWWRAGTTSLVTLATYLGMWLMAGLGLHAMTEVGAAVLGPATVVLVLAGACVLTQLGRGRDAALQRCVTWPRLRPEHDLGDAAAWSTVAATRCITSCAAAMGIAAAQPGIVSTAALSGLLLVERVRTPRPRALLAVAYGVVGAALAAAALR